MFSSAMRRITSSLSWVGRWVVAHKLLSAGVACILAGLTAWTFVATRYEGGGDRARAIQEELDARWTAGGSDIGEAVASLAAGATPGPTKPAGPPPPPAWGSIVARMHTDRLGLTWYVVEGVNQDDIASAPGHYPGTALPGAKGNFAVAGHREHLLFWDLDQMRAGDLITVETRHVVYTYTVTSNPLITAKNAQEEVAPTPPGFAAGSRLLTLTTCDPKWDNYHRLIVHAKLTSTVNR